MWFKVLKDFGHRKVDEVIQLKSDSQYQSLIDAGKLEVTEAPQSETGIDEDSIYSTGTVLNETYPIGASEQNDEQSAKGKPGRKPKSE